jgi:LAO/AO transport system kinase
VVERQGVDVAALVRRARDGDIRAVARLISLIESDAPSMRAVAAALRGQPERAYVVGLTGAPGVGKSTVVSALVTALRGDGKRVGVLAVDPSSPVSGGSLLGDRVRMPEHATDDGVFIRSMAARGELGGLSAGVPQAVRVLDAAGCDVVLVETVGVGQSEFQIAALADTTVLLSAPGLGDGIQAAKAGILEMADIFVVNKADRDGADRLVRELRQVRSLVVSGAWRAPIVSTVATTADGIPQLLTAIGEHRAQLVSTGELERRRERRAASEIEAIMLSRIRARLTQVRTSGELDSSAVRVRTGELDPYVAADRLLTAVAADEADAATN